MKQFYSVFKDVGTLDNQYSFKSSRSPSLAIMDLTENITDMLDNKKSTQVFSWI